MDAVIPTTPEMYLYRTASFSPSPLTMVCLGPHPWTGVPAGNQNCSSIFFSDRKSDFRRRPRLSAPLEHLLDFTMCDFTMCVLLSFFSNCRYYSLCLYPMEVWWTQAHVSALCEIGSTVIRNPENTLCINRFWQLYFTRTSFAWAWDCSKGVGTQTYPRCFFVRNFLRASTLHFSLDINFSNEWLRDTNL